MTTQDLLSAVFSWWPFVVLIGAWIVITRFYYRSKSGVTMIELYEQQIAETRRTNATLEKIAAALEKRS